MNMEAVVGTITIVSVIYAVIYALLFFTDIKGAFVVRKEVKRLISQLHNFSFEEKRICNTYFRYRVFRGPIEIDITVHTNIESYNTMDVSINDRELILNRREKKVIRNSIMKDVIPPRPTVISELEAELKQQSK